MLCNSQLYHSQFNSLRNFFAVSLLKAKSRIESTWIHANSLAALVADDFLVQGEAHVTMALVRVPVVEVVGFGRSKKWFPDLIPSNVQEFQYLMNISGSDKEQKAQLQVRILCYSIQNRATT